MQVNSIAKTTVVDEISRQHIKDSNNEHASLRFWMIMCGLYQCLTLVTAVSGLRSVSEPSAALIQQSSPTEHWSPGLDSALE